ncbi:unnamed protein product, partial [Plutella xylostella]
NILILFYFSGAIKAHPDFVQPLSSSPGIYFDRIGKLNVINGQLDIVSYVDILHINPHLNNLNQILLTTKLLCKQANNNQCDSILSPLTVRYNDIKREYNSISHLISNRQKRSAWFGAVGTAFKHIFGTLDEDDALKYSSAIDTIQKDNKKLAELMKQNILVTTSTLESFKKSINQLDNNQNQISIALNQLLNHTNNITKISNILILENKVNSILTNLESSLLTLSFQLEDLTNAITLCSQNILHPFILSPGELYRELVNNGRHLPADTRIPLSLRLENIHVIMSLSKVVCYYYNDKLVFVLQIPLVMNDEFNLYHNLALPIPHNALKPNLFSLILPSYSYTAISKDKLSFCNLDSLDKCRSVNSEFFLCQIPTVLSTNGHPTCESELLTKTISALPVQCQTKTIFGELDIWKPLVNNQWIYVQSQSSKISVDCGVSEIRELKVFGTGVLHTPEMCTVYTKSTRLISTNNVLNISIPIPTFDFSIINDSCCKLDTKSNSLENSASPISLQGIDLDEFTLNNINGKFISDLNKIIEEKPLLTKYGTHYLTLTFLISLIVLGYVIFKLSKLVHRFKSNFHVSFSKPTPADDVVSTTQSVTPIPEPRYREVV